MLRHQDPQWLKTTKRSRLSKNENIKHVYISGTEERIRNWQIHTKVEMGTGEGRRFCEKTHWCIRKRHREVQTYQGGKFMAGGNTNLLVLKYCLCILYYSPLVKKF